MPHPDRSGPSRLRRLAAACLAVGGITLTAACWSFATADIALAAAGSIGQVITNLRNVLIGVLVGLATLFLTIGGVRYILAGGDPGEVEAAKRTLRYAAIGYGVAALAPLLVTVLQHIVGS